MPDDPAWGDSYMDAKPHCSTHSRPLAECQRLKDGVVEAALSERETGDCVALVDALDAFEPRERK
jgi:hypothetical protein